MTRFGADVELLGVDIDGNPRSVVDLLPGTKEKPYPVYQGAVQVDNVVAEFNISPVVNKEGWIKRITTVMSELDKLLADQGLTYSCVSSTHFHPDELADPRAKIGGCDPDMDIYLLAFNRAPDLSTSTLRTLGGHIHVSWGNGRDVQEIINLIKAMDIFLGVPSILLDDDTERRTLYGKAGCFREKKYSEDVYGVEYRTLSNFWVKNKSLMEWAFNNTQLAFEDKEHLPFERWDIQSIINTADRPAAERLIKDLGVPMP